MRTEAVVFSIIWSSHAAPSYTHIWSVRLLLSLSRDLLLENLVLREQLAVLARRRPQPIFSGSDQTYTPEGFRYTGPVLIGAHIDNRDNRGLFKKVDHRSIY
jgi:hypothetical protein